MSEMDEEEFRRRGLTIRKYNHDAKRLEMIQPSLPHLSPLLEFLFPTCFHPTATGATEGAISIPLQSCLHP